MIQPDFTRFALPFLSRLLIQVTVLIKSFPLLSLGEQELERNEMTSIPTQSRDFCVGLCSFSLLSSSTDFLSAEEMVLYTIGIHRPSEAINLL